MSWQAEAAFRFVMLTGWRINEALSLQRSFIDRTERVARLPDTKTGHSVRPLATDALAFLDGLPRVLESDFYFPAVDDHRKRLSRSTFQKALQRLCKSARIKDASPHVLRHRVISVVANEAKNTKAGMAFTGHKDERTYLKYVHHFREQALEIADVVAGRVAALSH
jgi:integrase